MSARALLDERMMAVRGSMTAILALLLLVAAVLAAGCGNGSDAGGKPAVKDVKGPALLFFTMDG